MKKEPPVLVKCHYCPKEILVGAKEHVNNLKKDPNKKYFCMGILCRAINRIRE